MGGAVDNGGMGAGSVQPVAQPVQQPKQNIFGSQRPMGGMGGMGGHMGGMQQPPQGLGGLGMQQPPQGLGSLGMQQPPQGGMLGSLLGNQPGQPMQPVVGQMPQPFQGPQGSIQPIYQGGPNVGLGQMNPNYSLIQGGTNVGQPQQGLAGIPQPQQTKYTS